MEEFTQLEKSEEVVKMEAQAAELLSKLRNAELKTPEAEFEFGKDYFKLSNLLAQLEEANGGVSAKEDLGVTTEELGELFKKVNKSFDYQS
jgi:hypothetical protein